MPKQIKNNQKYYSINTLKSFGYSYYQINKLINEGKLTKINKKVYENLDFNGNDHDFYYANAYVPNGVVCLLSAAFYYNLTTFIPDCVELAISRKSKASALPDWPNIKIHYFTDYRYQKGIETINDNGNVFKIYDIEKTVCDIIFYKENVGVEETKEILKNYLSRKNRNLNKLISYAKELKCEKILRTYLEVLV